MDAQGRLNAEELDNLRVFAQRVEQEILKANRKGSENMARLICRILVSKKNPQVSATMAAKWVEWRYGKSIEVKHSGTVTHEHVDLSNLSDEQLGEVEKIIESAHAESNKG